MNLQKAATLITGASRGLGRALALTLGKKGAKLVLVAREKGPLDVVVREVREAGGEAHGLVADVGDKNAILPLAASAASLVGPIDLLIHNASTLGPVPLRLLLDTDCEDFEHVLAVNLIGPFRLSKVIAGSMALRGTGTILHLSSDAAVSAYPSWGAYGVSKAAFDHLARSFAAELGESGVRVISIDPGEMDTRMHGDAMPDADPRTLMQPIAIAALITAKIQAIETISNGARIEVAS